MTKPDPVVQAVGLKIVAAAEAWYQRRLLEAKARDAALELAIFTAP
jgi:hypothetical protein